jgi:beta-glucuronidase
MNEYQLITNIEARKTISLDGKWNIIIDPMDAGYVGIWLNPMPDFLGFWSNRKPKNKSELIEYDFDRSPVIDVPGDWNSQEPELEYYEGTVWYKRSFDYQKKGNTKVFVHFGAVNYEANVYLNGKKIGDHIGGFTPFNFDITDVIQDGENFFVLRVNSTRKREAVPTVHYDFWNFGGITRSVTLVETPETFVQDYLVQLKKGSTNKLVGWVKLSKPKSNQTIQIDIPEANVSEQLKTNDDGLAEFEFETKIQLWSPQNPKRYQVIVRFDADEIKEEIGFRTIEVKGQDILLNGKSIFLRGINIHEEAPDRKGRAYSREDAITLLSWAKELGCNFVRLANYPHNEHMVREAEKMGLMVWSEIPVYWNLLWENPSTFQNASNQLSEIMSRDKNRASVILWSIAEEPPHWAENGMLEFLRKLALQVNTEDPTRLVTAAVTAQFDPAGDSVIIDHPIGEYLDVYGCNEYFGWYFGPADQIQNKNWTMKYDKPVIMSEFGGGALQGFHGDKDQRWTEEFQEDVYRNTIPMLNELPFLRGTTPWLLQDYRSPRRTLSGIQDGWNRKGLISDKGIKKKAFYTMKEWYQVMKAKYE